MSLYLTIFNSYYAKWCSSIMSEENRIPQSNPLTFGNFLNTVDSSEEQLHAHRYCESQELFQWSKIATQAMRASTHISLFLRD